MSSASRPTSDVLLTPQSKEASPVPSRRWLSALGGNLPSVIVFALLGGVFYLGHHTGWKLPSMAELTGSSAVTANNWCGEHLVPESACVECREGLLPKPPTFGFCRTHGVAECVLCHPELAQVTGEPQLPAYDTVAALALIDRPRNNSRNMLHERVVQFASAQSADKAGIDVNVVQEEPMTETVAANGEIQFDPTRIAHLRPARRYRRARVQDRGR